MKQVLYTDAEGRKWIRLLPDAVPDGDAFRGVALGPPSLASLDLPLALEVRMHNALFDRGLVTAADVRARPNDVVAAVMASYRADAHAILALYE